MKDLIREIEQLESQSETWLDDFLDEEELELLKLSEEDIDEIEYKKGA